MDQRSSSGVIGSPSNRCFQIQEFISKGVNCKMRACNVNRMHIAPGGTLRSQKTRKAERCEPRQSHAMRESEWTNQVMITEIPRSKENAHTPKTTMRP